MGDPPSLGSHKPQAEKENRRLAAIAHPWLYRSVNPTQREDLTGSDG
ncbi:MAG TPA: hypothetical protein V6D02_03010 [Candidatus Obscuribacterales bacterium]